MSWRIEQHDVLDHPWPVERGSVQTVVTSPPYWGLRDYGAAGQIGLERTLEEYVAKIVNVFRTVREVLRDDGTVWLNLGDSWQSRRGGMTWESSTLNGSKHAQRECRKARRSLEYVPGAAGFKRKDLIGQSWRVAFALQDDGWWLRDEIIWRKRNTMPSSAPDRTTRSHERVFLLAKSERYYWNRRAAKEPYRNDPRRSGKFPSGWDSGSGTHHEKRGRYNDHHRNVDCPPISMMPGTRPHTGLRRSGNLERKNGDAVGRAGSTNGRSIPWVEADGRNLRSVWTINASPYKGAHFATFPLELPRRCIRIGSRSGDLVLDPFAGAGTVILAADMLGRDAVGLELNPEYVAMARERILAPRSEAEAERRSREAAGQMAFDIGQED